MSVAELKNEFHSLIEEIEDEGTLRRLFENVLHALQSNESIWDGVPEVEQRKVQEAYEKSEHPEKLIPHEEMIQKYARWLSK